MLIGQTAGRPRTERGIGMTDRSVAVVRRLLTRAIAAVKQGQTPVRTGTKHAPWGKGPNNV